MITFYSHWGIILYKANVRIILPVDGIMVAGYSMFVFQGFEYLSFNT
jgi:hypothetical protein